VAPDFGAFPASHLPEFAEVVEEGFVEEVRDGRSAEIHISSEFLHREVRELNLLRAEQEDQLRADDPRFRCAHCGVGVTLRRSPQGRWHFRHLVEDGSCRYQTKGVFSQDEFDARRYNGQKEGPEHIWMKRLIRESLYADRSVDPASIGEEIRWKGKINPATWRKPDLQARRNDVRIAFEVQLSSTYVNVMRERRHFYMTEGGLLFWILPSISEESRRQFEDDVLYPNNCNVFAVDEETRDLSRMRGELMLRCGYIEPVQEGWHVRERWHEKIVAMSELTIDLANQCVYYFDYEVARSDVERAVRMVGGENVLEELKAVVERILGHDEAMESWRALKRKLPSELRWPMDFYGGHFFKAVAMYLSARQGSGVGWNYKLIQVAHLCADRYPYFLPILEGAFRAFGRGAVFADPRYAEKWKAKLNMVRGLPLDDSTEVHLIRLRHFRPAMEWLMPEVKQEIAGIFSRLPPIQEERGNR
jgi:hypothetical protein